MKPEMLRLRRCRPGGFSLVELLVVVAIIVILGGIFIPYFSKIREADRRVRCADNLRAIMEGLRQYAMLRDANGKASHSYPSVTHDRDFNGYVAYTGADSPNPFSKDTRVRPNDVTASLWLLVRLGIVPTSRFICPSSGQSPDPMLTANRAMAAEQRSNFTSGAFLSYSYASPFSRDENYKILDDSHVSDFALMADKNPGVSRKADRQNTRGDGAPPWNADPFELARVNSSNHGRVGENVLYADGHVSWQTTVYCGFGHEGYRDNIYTALTPTPVDPAQRPPVESNGYCKPDMGPAWANDSYLVPTDED